MKNLKTDWKRIGRSGATVDGRTIDPTALEQCAKNYSKELFTALIWPEHYRWANMGTVEQLKATRNNEGGVDLFAIIAPNDFYIGANSSGQKLFTSMELMPNFRDTGEYYLTGLAATDSPASAATSEMRFSTGAQPNALFSQFTEHTDAPHETAPGWFTKFFEKFTSTQDSEDDTMSKEALAALAVQLTALTTKVDALSQASGTQADTNTETGTTTEKKDDKPTDDYAALVAKIDALTSEVSALKAASAPTPEPSPVEKLSAELAALQEAFNKAIGETTGTNAGEHTGNRSDVDACL